jgi:hypothetical protein
VSGWGGDSGWNNVPLQQEPEPNGRDTEQWEDAGTTPWPVCQPDGDASGTAAGQNGARATELGSPFPPKTSLFVYSPLTAASLRL